MSSHALSALCRSCGLCCDGTLFSSVRLEPGEEARLEALGVAVEPHPEGGHRLRQACAALTAGGCRVYSARPQGCRRFVCLLGTAVSESEVSLEDALGVVQDARVLLGGGASVEAREAFLRRHFLGRHGVLPPPRPGETTPRSSPVPRSA